MIVVIIVLLLLFFLLLPMTVGRVQAVGKDAAFWRAAKFSS
jgi:hypothetical protein